MVELSSQNDQSRSDFVTMEKKKKHMRGTDIRRETGEILIKNGSGDDHGPNWSRKYNKTKKIQKQTKDTKGRNRIQSVVMKKWR